MARASFGWVITPAARQPEGAASLMADNRRFIERVRGAFDTIWVEDHFQWQARPVVECWTALTYLAGLYPDFRFGSLVLGQSYRNPALTAKMMATLHWLTGGRYIAGIGAGWKEDEYHAYGWPYPQARTRIEQLEETVRILRAMRSESPAAFAGRHYAIRNAYCEPRPDPPPPLLIAGGGERYTLRVVARYADWMNVPFCDAATYSRKLDVFRRHCQAVGRDERQIKRTYFGYLLVSRDGRAPERRGDVTILHGTPARVADQLNEFVELGVEHFMLRFVDFPGTEGVDLFLEQVVPRLEG